MLVQSAATAYVVQGRVVDVSGELMADASVFMTQDRQVSRIQTGGDGRYRFDKVEVRVMELVAYKPGYGVGGLTTLPQRNMDVNLMLTEPGTVKMRVINNDFLPVAGARVSFMSVGDSFGVSVEDLTEHGFPLLRSDDAGLLDIPMVSANSHVKLTVSHHRYADSSVAYLPADDRRRDIVLYEGVLLRGRVTGKNASVAGARVLLFQSGVGGQRTWAEALTDPEGYYHIRAPEDVYLITARHAEFASPVPRSVDLRNPEETVVANLSLLSPYFIHGSVLLPDGKPCPGARILFRVGDAIQEDVLTDDTGKFRLMAGNAKGVLRILPPPGYMTKILADIPVDLGTVRETQIEPILLVALPVIRGRARFPEGILPERLYVRSLDLPEPIHFISDEEGRFEIHLAYQPDQPSIAFRVEHPLRFLARTFIVNLAQPAEMEVLLESFEPDLQRRPPEMGRNDLEALLGKPAPAIQCAEWFNAQPLSLEMVKGKVLVLTFWGGFDDSLFAVNRINELRVAHELLRNQEDVAIVGIHDASSESDEIAEYLVHYGIEFPVGRDADPFVSFVNYGIMFIPQTVIIDKEGILQYAQVEGRLFELIKSLRRR